MSNVFNAVVEFAQVYVDGSWLGERQVHSNYELYLHEV